MSDYERYQKCRAEKIAERRLSALARVGAAVRRWWLGGAIRRFLVDDGRMSGATNNRCEIADRLRKAFQAAGVKDT